MILYQIAFLFATAVCVDSYLLAQAVKIFELSFLRFFVHSWLVLNIGLTLFFLRRGYLLRHSRKNDGQKKISKLQITLFSLFIFSFFLSLLGAKRFSDMGPNRVEDILAQQKRYAGHPVEGVIGRISSVIQEKRGQLLFDMEVQSILRFNQEIPASGLIRVQSFHFRSFCKKIPQACDQRDKIKSGSTIMILAPIISLQNYFPETSQNFFFHYLRELGYGALVTISRLQQISLIETSPPKEILVWKNLIISAQNFLEMVTNTLWEAVWIRHTEQGAALIRALVFADASLMDRSIQDAFRKSGTIHLLAASGLHLSLLFSFVFALLGRIPHVKRYSVILALGIGFFYLALTGFRISLLRAFLMAFAFHAGTFLNRPQFLRQTLALVFIFILFLDSRHLFHPGFQLSFAAVGGIAWFYPFWESLWKQIQQSVSWDLTSPTGKTKGQWLASKTIDYFFQSFLLSLSATAMTSIIVWIRMGEYQPLSVLNNILAVPFGSVIVFFSFLSVALVLPLPELLYLGLLGWFETLCFFFLKGIEWAGTTLSWQRYSMDSIYLPSEILFWIYPTLLIGYTLFLTKKSSKKRSKHQKGHYNSTARKATYELNFHLSILGLFLILPAALWLWYDHIIRAAFPVPATLYNRSSVWVRQAIFDQKKIDSLFVGSGRELLRIREKVNTWVIPGRLRYNLPDYEKALLQNEVKHLLLIIPAWEERQNIYILERVLESLGSKFPKTRFSVYPLPEKKRDEKNLYKDLSRKKGLPYIHIDSQALWLHLPQENMVRIFSWGVISPRPISEKFIGSDHIRDLTVMGKDKIKIFSGYETNSILAQYWSMEDYCFAREILPSYPSRIIKLCYPKKK